MRKLLTPDPASISRPDGPAFDDAVDPASETRVLHCLPTNLSAPEIGGELYPSVNAVRTHQRHLHQKLGERSCRPGSGCPGSRRSVRASASPPA